jgi:hypothetical protein
VSLRAPLAVPVEVAASGRRIHRLSREVAESELTLERPAAFEVGEPVTARFGLPDVEVGPPTSVSLRAVVALADEDGEGEHGGRVLRFVDPTRDARDLIARYVARRLGLPGA